MVTTFYQTGPNGLFIFYQVFNLILQSAKISVYSFETYTLKKLELKLTDENNLILQTINTRHHFSEFFLNYLRNNNADEFMIDAFQDYIS